ncbi:MAG: hypothetical protein ACU841_16530 [Gammaproteobacteria bacterium]
MPYKREMTHAALRFSKPAPAAAEFTEPREIALAGERTLTTYVGKRETSASMTMGFHPGMPTLGNPNNQVILDNLAGIKAVQANWETGVENIEFERHSTALTGS